MFFKTIEEKADLCGVVWKKNLKDYTNAELVEIFSRADQITPDVLAPLCAESLRRLMVKEQ